MLSSINIYGILDNKESNYLMLKSMQPNSPKNVYNFINYIRFTLINVFCLESSLHVSVEYCSFDAPVHDLRDKNLNLNLLF